MSKIRVFHNTDNQELNGPLKTLGIKEHINKDLKVSTLTFPKNAAFTIDAPYDKTNSIFYLYLVQGEIELSSSKKVFTLSSLESFSIEGVNENFLVRVLKSSIMICMEYKMDDIDIEEFEKIKDSVKELNEYDPYTRMHSNNVSHYACIIGKYFNDKITMGDLGQAASFHDIGKLNVEKDILNAPRKLTPLEFEEIKKHPSNSYEYLKDVYKEKKNILRAVLEHHERLNGLGYPSGLKEDEIILEAKILMVADVFDALTTKRVYREPYTVEEALEIILKETEQGYYDKDVVEVLKNCIEKKEIEVK